MNVRRMPSAPPNRPASNTTLSRGDASPASEASIVVQSSCAKTNAAKSTSWESSTSRSSVFRPGLNVVVHGSTSATPPSPRASACRSFACLPDEPRKMRGLVMPGARPVEKVRARLLRHSEQASDRARDDEILARGDDLDPRLAKEPHAFHDRTAD